MLTVILIGVIVAFLAYSFLKEKRNTPPEPFGLPILGHILFVGSNPVLKFTEWAKKYGKIMQIRFGFMTQIVISDPELTKEMYNDLVFSGTPDMEFLKEFNNGKHGILFNDGPEWQDQRRFTMWHMRDFGFGRKDVMGDKIMEEVKDLIEVFKREEKTAISVEKRFNVAVLNALWVIITGQRYSHDDPQVTLLIDNFNKAIDKLVSRFVILFFPRFAKMIPRISGWGEFKIAIKDMKDFFAHLVAEHKKDLQPNNPRDFIDAYLDEINQTEDPKSSFYKEHGEESLVSVIFDLFQAGFASTSTTLNWSILYLATYPEVQKKFQDEIDQVIGNSRLPSLDDKTKMPYTEALMMEVFRYFGSAGLVQSHTALKDVTFHGYEIKKGTMIVANIYSIHKNPEIWGDPQNFRPERFIDKDGNCIKRHDALMPFSVGKRVCLGETLARDKYFLFLVSIFQRFSIKFDPNSPAPSLEPLWKGILRPQPYKVVMQDRFGN